jgi:DNA-binding MarR family transcriptional regulator
MSNAGNPRAVAALERATHSMGLYLERQLKAAGLSQAEVHVLGYLADAGDRTINEIHHSFGHKRSTLTSLLDRLEARGLIRRQPDPDSRRSVLIRLTPRGARVAGQVRKVLDEIEQSLRKRTTAANLAGFHATLRALGDTTRDR